MKSAPTHLLASNQCPVVTIDEDRGGVTLNPRFLACLLRGHRTWVWIVCEHRIGVGGAAWMAWIDKVGIQKFFSFKEHHTNLSTLAKGRHRGVAPRQSIEHRRHRAGVKQLQDGC